MMKYIAYLFAVILSVSAAYTPPSTNKPASYFSQPTRRHLLQRGTALTIGVGSTILTPLTQFPQPSLAGAKATDDIELIKSTVELYKLTLSDKSKFVTELAAENSITKLPPQVPTITFQNLAKIAHTVENKFDADEFPFVAIEYAEHAGAARDFAKLAKLGRIGENGSAEVALAYAEKCVVELEEAYVLLDTLYQALE